MTTMKGSPIPLIFILIIGIALADDASPQDPLPKAANAILLPTKAGSVGIAADKEFSKFGEGFNFCGKRPVGSDATKKMFDLAYTDKNKNFELRIDCTPHPTRIVLGTGSATLKDKAVPESFTFHGCTGIQTCKAPAGHPAKVALGKDTVAMPALPALAPSFPSVCGNLAAYQAFLYANEEDCEASKNLYGVPDNSGGEHVDYRSVSRWVGKNDRFQIIRPFVKEPMGKPIKPELIPWTNSFLKLPTKTHTWTSCRGTCDRGEVLKFNMEPKSWRIMVFLTGHTRGFKICIDASNHDSNTGIPVCKRYAEIFVLPQQGVVIWPGSGRASLLDMKTKHYGEFDTFAIEVGYGVSASSGKLSSEFYVGNMYREFVTSDGVDFNAQTASKVSMFFESENELRKGGGVVAPNVATGFTYTADKAGLEDRLPRNKDTGADTDGDKSVEEPVFVPINKTMPRTTTPSPPKISIPLTSILGSDNTSSALYTPGKWWTWALFVGFVLGSLLGMGIIGGIFYVLRRTVYGFWYRGMYKRYGCDASGTTGGVTGAGFGNTTTGAITLGQTGMTGGTTMGGSTMGGTTGGTSTMSSSTTTGGSTTRGSSTTGGSTLAL
uniref:Peptidase A1 domain-containing protein n=2 Tax=Caenorhabditis japonica TaxID=281687 RepID=A0A8R1HVU8_CAEJA